MKTLNFSILGLFLFSFTVFGQETVTKNFPLDNLSKVNLELQYPELVQIKTWDKDEVQVKAYLMINDGENNDNFELKSTTKGGTLSITSNIKNLDKMRNVRIYVNDDDDDDDDDDDEVTVTRNGRMITIGKGRKNTTYNGVNVSVELEITVPRNITLNVDARYGMVEVLDIPESIEVQAKYGGADIRLSESTVKSLFATTSWGQIYANLSDKIDVGGDDMPGKEMTAKLVKNSGSKSIKVDSEYGNVFLRKNQQP